MFYQKGENKNGGVLVLVRLDIQATRIECKLPNVCVLDIKGEEILRIIGVYAPDSKSWIWKDLSPFLTKKGVMFGDFNVDIVQDDKKAEIFLAWIDTHFLAPFTPESPTSLLKPHPYTDSPLIDYDNVDEPIPEVKLDKLILTVQTKRKKKSLDAHGISNFMFNFLDQGHWSLFLKLFNHSLQTVIMPKAWKDTRMLLLAKKESICPPSLTRPIYLIDSFLKERFITRQSVGFQRRFSSPNSFIVILGGYSLMSNSAPVCTIFIDFCSAFDQLCHEGCVGELKRLGIPPSYLRWIGAWLLDRRCFIDINGNKSRWFSIEKGGPQGSVLTPTVFIIYHNDMGQFLSECTCHFFADDVAAIVSGQLGVRYTSQCIDLERRVKSFLDSLEYYSCLADQPLNRTNSARAIGSPKFNIMFASGDDNRICWKPGYKYLGYIISSRLGWGKLLKDVQCKVR
ncbi:unnamed protein product [Rotaria magnacalcarata]|uniref:Reverse transcriptase domain-containing protein n=1 Tax=Rotaria magnacalcarata TaxID=392030 RepID=A0A816W457_9BILA|nr:unnamed protein product [Rotaria magnacalcarata]